MVEVQIRRILEHEIDVFVAYVQAMVGEMASVGGHAVQCSDEGSAWLRNSIQAKIETDDHLFLIAELDSYEHGLVGILEASVINFAPIFKPKLSLHIHGIYVDPDYRRAGVARSLMQAALQWGKDQGCVEADLHVLNNNSAKLLYKNLGFEEFQLEMRRSL